LDQEALLLSHVSGARTWISDGGSQGCWKTKSKEKHSDHPRPFATGRKKIRTRRRTKTTPIKRTQNPRTSMKFPQAEVVAEALAVKPIVEVKRGSEMGNGSFESLES
jgi:hypothetical protein